MPVSGAISGVPARARSESEVRPRSLAPGGRPGDPQVWSLPPRTATAFFEACGGRQPTPRRLDLRLSRSSSDLRVAFSPHLVRLRHRLHTPPTQVIRRAPYHESDDVNLTISSLGRSPHLSAAVPPTSDTPPGECHRSVNRRSSSGPSSPERPEAARRARSRESPQWQRLRRGCRVASPPSRSR